jgi:hypothetical protein
MPDLKAPSIKSTLPNMKMPESKKHVHKVSVPVIGKVSVPQYNPTCDPKMDVNISEKVESKELSPARAPIVNKTPVRFRKVDNKREMP